MNRIVFIILFTIIITNCTQKTTNQMLEKEDFVSIPLEIPENQEEEIVVSQFQSDDTIASKEIPQVIDNTIYFLDTDKKIQISERDRYYILPEKNRLVYVKIEIIHMHTVLNTLIFYNFYGKEIAQPDLMIGQMDFFFSEINKRFLAAQVGPYGQEESYLYDLDGNLINIITHENFRSPKEIDITTDEKYFWFAFERERPLQPGETPLKPWSSFEWNQILILDVITGNFITEYSTLYSPYIFILNEIKYVIPVSPPGTAP